MRESFHRIAAGVACAAGSPWTFALAVAVVVGWALLGPVYGYSDHWQLFINTGTTIVTFLVVFLLAWRMNEQLRAGRVVRWLSGTSYTLYLVHGMVGMAFIPWAAPRVGMGAAVLLALALVAVTDTH